MRLRRIKAVAKKELLHVVRDWRSLGIAVAIPMLLLFLFCYALTLDVDRVPLVVWDRSETPASRDFISRFTGSPYFALFRQAGSYREVERAIDRRDALIALIVPADFAAQLAAGRKCPVQVILDGSDANTATIAGGYAEAVARAFSREVALRQIVRPGESVPRLPLDLRPRVWFNPDMLSRNSIVPGLIAVIMMVIAALLTSLTVAREWETGTMEQLISTPLRGGELILGKLLPYFAIGILDLVLAVTVGRFAFDVPLRGSLWLLLLISVIFLFGALSFGMLISIVARSQLLSSQLALVTTMLPAFLLSGFIFPIENMPLPIRAVTRIVTARYMVGMLRGIYLKGADLSLLAAEAAMLALFGVAVILLAVRKFRKKIG
jgi:ABC-2 type transport system permease protein